MRKVRMPRAILRCHKNAFAAYVEDGLKKLLKANSHYKGCCEYIRCLMIDSNEVSKKKSIVIRNIRELACVVSAVGSVKAKYPRMRWSQLEKSLKKLFNYGYRFVNGNNLIKWDTGQYIKGMVDAGLEYCPYCNRHPLESYATSDGKTHKGPLDHFYDKTKYPYLALSIYNLIPVCDKCNNEKGTKATSLSSHTHPFHDDFHGLVAFSVAEKPLVALFGKKKRCTIELCQRKKQRSAAAVKLARDIELVNRYNDNDGNRVAKDILGKGVRYRAFTMANYLGLARMKGLKTLDEVCVEEFGVKPDGSDINLRQYGKLRNDLMPASLKMG